MTTKIFSFLKVDKYQRLIFGFLFCLWTFLSINAKNDWWLDSDLQIPYFYIFLIPATFLLTHVILNSWLSWFFVFVIWNLFFTWSITTFILNLYERLRWTVKGNFPLSDYIIILFYFCILTFITFIFHKMKPRQKHTA